MRIAVHSNVSNIAAGGGLTFIAGITSVLSESHEVDLYLLPGTNLDERDIERILPSVTALPNVRTSRRRTALRGIGELWQAADDLAYDAVVVQSPSVPRLALVRRSFLLCEFPFSRSLALDDRLRLKTYRYLITNSNYSASWIERRWGRKAQVLHPPVWPIPACEKRLYILAVGRFLSGGRSKRQIEMVRMFRYLYEAGFSNWELHLAGFAEEESYVEQVRYEAAELPVYLHLNMSREALEELYGQAAIFWHAVGMGTDPKERPEWMEHFGIATAEAMSAGCVPIVIKRGGQPEIVGKDGLLWNTVDECIALTRSLMEDPSKRVELSRQSRQSARKFEYPSFRRRMKELFS